MFNWTCPHCNKAQTVIDEKKHLIEHALQVGNIAEGNVAACAFAIGCSNYECQKLTITFSVRSYDFSKGKFTVRYDKAAFYKKIAIPESSAKSQPACVPNPLVEDYVEACLIRENSPKAAATLARRCIQGMIRDFCGVTRGTLAKEIETLRQAVEDGRAPAGVTIESVEAIDHVRSIGNIGAHMEKDIDLIIPVDPDEAQALIELIEMLFEDWYIARDSRRRKLDAISKIGGAKKALKEEGKLALPKPSE